MHGTCTCALRNFFGGITRTIFICLEFLTTISVNIKVVWVVTPCSLVDGHWRLWEIWCIFWTQQICSSSLTSYIFWLNGPHWAMASFTRFLDRIQRHTTVGRIPLDEWLARHRDFSLTTQPLTTDRHLLHWWDSNPQSQQVSGPDLRLRPRGLLDQPSLTYIPEYTASRFRNHNELRNLWNSLFKKQY